MRCEGFGAFVLKRTAHAVDGGDRILAEVLAGR
jgi:acyl transferase domain-containing protein